MNKSTNVTNADTSSFQNLHLTLYLKIAYSILALIIQVVGICVLLKIKKRTNQVIILINLTVSELIFLLTFVYGTTVGVLHYQPHMYGKYKTYDEFRDMVSEGFLVGYAQYR